MRILALFTLLIGLGGLPVMAQDNDCIDFHDVDLALTLARTTDIGGDLETTLEHVREAREALETIEAECASSVVQSDGETVASDGNWASNDAGDRRSNPIPFGQRQYVQGQKASLELTEFIPLRNGTKVDSLDGGTYYELDENDGYIQVSGVFYCELSEDETCNLNTSGFGAVGISGVVSGIPFAIDEYSYTVYGGGHVPFTLALGVPEDDTDFILRYYDLASFGDTGNKEVFFVLE
jgi:hypothetical protein